MRINAIVGLMQNFKIYNMKANYQTILENIPFLSEYEQKSLAIILMNFTLNEHQVDLTHKEYKTFVKDYIN